MARLNITTGFAFLERPAGFAIAQHFIAYDEGSSYLRAFLVALLNTIAVSLVAIVCATALGFVIGIAQRSSNRLLALVAQAYVEILRNVPLLLQLFFWYFAVLRPLPAPRQSLDLLHLHGVFLNTRGLFLPAPVATPGFAALAASLIAALVAFLLLRRWAERRREATGRPVQLLPLTTLLFGAPLAIAAALGFPLHWDLPVLAGFNFRGGVAVTPEFVAMALALSLYGAAYIAEIVRAGLAAVPRGQVEAARALGMPGGLIYRKIVIPQALRIIIPPLASQYILITKNSTLAAAIAYPDLMLIFEGTVLNQTGQAFEVTAITMATYLLLGLAISAAMNWRHRRSAWGAR
ncbi:MAG: ABC transporter permease subunit [Alphaproteobacteria bacterium]|nr:ABC transporter permease subunit [Alphaproteobacteria bacterium]